MIYPDNMNIIERLNAPTPDFFKKVRNVGLALIAAAGVITTSPLILPALVISAASYVGLAGLVMSTVAQSAVKTD